MAQVSTSTLSVKIQDYYNKTALEKALPLLLYRKFAQVHALPQHSGDTIRFKRWGILPTATSPLTEGVTPVGGNIEVTELTATVQQYGYWLPVTDKVQLLYPDPVLTQMSEQLGEQMGETMDELMRNVLVAGSNVQYAGAQTARSSVTGRLTGAEIDKAIRALDNQNAKRISKIVTASTGFNTTPIRPCYVAIIHPDTAYCIERNVTGFIPVEKYASQTGVMEGEIGAYKGVRFISTTKAYKVADAGGAIGSTGNMSTTGSNVDIYATIILAQNAYGEVPVSGASSNIIIKAHGERDTNDVSDPLNQRGSAGKHEYYALAA